MASAKTEKTKKAARAATVRDFVTFLLPMLIMWIIVSLCCRPANEWKETTFTFSHCLYHRSRSRIILEIYSTDGTRFDTSIEEIGYLLVQGRQYHAVYGKGLFYNSLKGLVDDAGHVFIDIEKSISRSNANRSSFYLFLLPFPMLFLSLYLITARADKAMKQKQKTISERSSHYMYTE